MENDAKITDYWRYTILGSLKRVKDIVQQSAGYKQISIRHKI